MLIHTDHLYSPELFRALPPECCLEAVQAGSKKRARSFRVKLEWLGVKVKGDGRRYSNSGQHGADSGVYACTWDEWGEWIARLFEIDPNAIIGQYNGRDDFMRQTREALPWASQSKGAKAPWLA